MNVPERIMLFLNGANFLGYLISSIRDWRSDRKGWALAQAVLATLWLVGGIFLIGWYP